MTKESAYFWAKLLGVQRVDLVLAFAPDSVRRSLLARALMYS